MKSSPLVNQLRLGHLAALSVKVTYLRLSLSMLGLLLGTNAGIYVPIYHSLAFLREVVVLPSIFGGVWEYELWGNILGLMLTLVILSGFGSEAALCFGLGYALAFSVTIIYRAPDYHVLWTTLVGSISAVLATILVAHLAVTGLAYALSKHSFDRKRWTSWTLPTKTSLILGALGTALGLLSILSWFGIQAYNIIPGLEAPRNEVLRFPYHGSIIELYGTDGSSMERPVQILGARSSKEGVPSEYYWIQTYYPHHDRISQSLVVIPASKVVTPVIRHNKGKQTHTSFTTVTPGRCFDRLELQNWLGQRTTLFFDITAFLKCDENDLKHPKGMKDELE